MTLQRRVYLALESPEAGDLLSRLCDGFLIVLIMSNVAAAILETVPALGIRYALAFSILERVSTVLFSAEYLIRLWSSGADPRFAGVGGRLRFAAAPLMLVDLAVLLPSFLGLDLRTLRAIRVLRLFRMGRYSQRMRMLFRVYADKRDELMCALMVSLVMLVLCSSGMYAVENAHQPEAFSSIPATMWWGVATLTTVGYGDMCPVTPLGRILGGMVAILGIGMFALPAGILASGFGEALQRRKQRTCPHCGRDPDEA